MPSVSYTFVERCEGGCHVTLDISLDGGQAKRVVYDIDEIRAAFGRKTAEEKEQIALMLLALKFHGRTRNQIQTAFQNGGGTVSVEIS